MLKDPCANNSYEKLTDADQSNDEVFSRRSASWLIWILRLTVNPLIAKNILSSAISLKSKSQYCDQIEQRVFETRNLLPTNGSHEWHNQLFDMPADALLVPVLLYELIVFKKLRILNSLGEPAIALLDNAIRYTKSLGFEVAKPVLGLAEVSSIFKKALDVLRCYSSADSAACRLFVLSKVFTLIHSTP